MYKSTKKYIIFILLGLLHLFTIQAANFTMKNLSMQKQLSNYSVLALYQDERGLLWMGTRNGINVYDGTHIQTYQTNQQDPSSIMHNHIMNIVGDKKGSVYILSRQGVSVYTISEERYESITDKDAMAIHLYEDDLLLAIDNEILRYNHERKELTQYYRLPENSSIITDFCFKGDSLLIGTELNGLFVYNTKNEQLVNAIKDVRVSKIFTDSQRNTWIGSWKHGAYKMKGEHIVNYVHNSKNPSSLCSNFVRCFCEDDYGSVWIGTFRGLNRYDSKEDTFESYTSDPETKLTNSSVWSLLCDSQGTIWVGTYFGGVNYFNPRPSLTRYFQSNQKDTPLLTIGTMTEDNKGNYWISSDGYGLCKMNKRTGETTWYTHSLYQNSISHNNVKSLYFDENENVLWIGTHMGGLNKFDLATERFTHYLSHPTLKQEDKSNTICDIQPYKDELILATHAGVFLFNKKTETYTDISCNSEDSLSVDFAFDIQIDSNGVAWISGDKKGLFTYDIAKKKLTMYSTETLENKISSNMVNCSYIDSKGRIWLCMAETGIELYNPHDSTFVNYNVENNHLLNNCVYGACEISSDKFIFITDSGLSYLDLSMNTFRNFLVGDNIPLKALNHKAIYRAKNGEVFIGGIDGMVSFRTEFLEKHSKDYSIFPIRMYINDKEVKVNDETKILSKALSMTQRIQLTHKQSMFSIVYAVPNFYSAYKDEIVYKLENFSDTWSVLRPDNYVTYTNLNPGVYKLMVKSNSKGNNQNNLSVLEIEVLPPWYRTTWAYIVYLLSLFAVLRITIRMYKNRLKLQTELEYERKHIEDVEKLNKQKLQFFTNISHEFRTPLTLIIGEVELLMQVQSFMPAVYNRILNVYKSSMQLQSLISELLDFRKQEQGHMHIKASAHNLVKFLRENYLLFKEYSLSNDIEFSFETNSDEMTVYYDEKQFQKVINNLLSNAFKHTPSRGKIVLRASEEESEVVISVKNTGKPISPKDIDRLFDRFYQSDDELVSSHTGTGIGLALTKGIMELHHGSISVSSSREEGTIFKVTLLKGTAHFSAEEMTTHPIDTYEQYASKVKLEKVSEMETHSDFQVLNDKRCTALLVEDDNNLLNLLKDICSPYYQTYTANCAEKALEILGEVQPDIVVSDIQMPGMSGLELCKKIKSDIDTCHIPVVLLTARTGLEHKLEGFNTGADDYIVKPFDTNILLARCKNIINNRIVLQEKFTNQTQLSPQVFATNELDKEFMDKALRIIEDNLENCDFSAVVFAQEMAIARTKLFVKIKAITGQTPNDLIVTMRLKKAAYLLKNDLRLSIADISDKTGFKTSRYFSHCFKERYKVTPLNYRKGKIAETSTDIEDAEQ